MYVRNIFLIKSKTELYGMMLTFSLIPLVCKSSLLSPIFDDRRILQIYTGSTIAKHKVTMYMNRPWIAGHFVVLASQTD